MSDSAVAHMGDHHLELLSGLRHSILSDFGTGSVPVNRYLASCHGPTHTCSYIASRTKRSTKHYAAPVVHIHVRYAAHFHIRTPVYFKNMHFRVSSLFLNNFLCRITYYQIKSFGIVLLPNTLPVLLHR